MTELWHFTCGHGRDGITDSGMLIVNPFAASTGVPELIWLTDLDVPIRDALGLTSNLLGCDRTAHRYRVTDTTGCVPWIDWPHRRQHPGFETPPGRGRCTGGCPNSLCRWSTRR